MGVLPKIWLVGLLAFVAFGLGQVTTTYLWCRRLAWISDSRVLPILEECKRLVGVRMEIRLVEGPRANAPALLGVWRPLLLIPAGMAESIGLEGLRLVFLHELSHVKRRDIWVNSIATVLCYLHWFNPLVWYAMRRMRADQELACDACALAYTKPGESRLYGKTVIQLLEETAHPRQLPGMAGILEDKSQMRRRIKMIAEFKKPGPAWTVLTAVLAVALGLSTLTGASTTETNPPAPTGERTIVFPSDRSVGTLLVRDWGSDDESAWESQGEVWGEVTKPPGKEAFLEVKAERGNDLSFLASLQPDALQGMSLRGTGAQDSDIAPIAQFTSLRSLNLRETQVSDAGLAHLGSLSNLQHLDLKRRSDLSAQGIAHLSGLSNLRFLDIQQVRLGDDGLAQLKGLTNLRTLNLNDTGITDQGLVHLAGMKQIEELRIGENNISGPGFQTLAQLKTLKELHLYKTDLTPGDLSAISGLTSLEELNLNRSSLTDEGMVHLSGLTSLKWLDINGTAVTDAGLVHLASLPALEVVRVSGVTAEGMEQLQNLAGRYRPELVDPDAPKVGILFSHASAMGPSGIGPHNGYGNTINMARELIRRRLNIYAVVEPQTEDIGELPIILAGMNLRDRVVNGADPSDLGSLDVIYTHQNYHMVSEVIEAILQAVRNGAGLVAQIPFGSSQPGYNETIRAIFGVEQADSIWRGHLELSCPVVAQHPILGVLGPGDSFWIKSPNGKLGLVDGTPLLAAPENLEPDYVPLYVREVGEGRVVNCQWLTLPRPTPPYDPVDFLVRCINWAAKKDVGTKWDEAQ